MLCCFHLWPETPLDLFPSNTAWYSGSSTEEPLENAISNVLIPAVKEHSCSSRERDRVSGLSLRFISIGFKWDLAETFSDISKGYITVYHLHQITNGYFWILTEMSSNGNKRLLQGHMRVFFSNGGPFFFLKQRHTKWIQSTIFMIVKVTFSTVFPELPRNVREGSVAPNLHNASEH